MCQVNMLRATTAVFSAGLGGADSYFGAPAFAGGWIAG